MFYTDLEKQICKEIMLWSELSLETPNSFFNGLPACPYARNAWKNKKVAFLFKYENDYQCLYRTISRFDDTFDLLLIIDLNFEKDDVKFHNYFDQLNVAISEGIFIDRDMWVMGFHPKDEENPAVDDVSILNEVDDSAYAIIFVQRLSKLQEAADKLKEKGYYNNYLSDYDVSDTLEKREELFRRLKNGDET